MPKDMKNGKKNIKNQACHPTKINNRVAIVICNTNAISES
jgi:hypothetical protein